MQSGTFPFKKPCTGLSAGHSRVAHTHTQRERERERDCFIIRSTKPLKTVQMPHKSRIRGSPYETEEHNICGYLNVSSANHVLTSR